MPQLGRRPPSRRQTSPKPHGLLSSAAFGLAQPAFGRKAADPVIPERANGVSRPCRKPAMQGLPRPHAGDDLRQSRLSPGRLGPGRRCPVPLLPDENRAIIAHMVRRPKAFKCIAGRGSPHTTCRGRGDRRETFGRQPDASGLFPNRRFAYDCPSSKLGGRS